MNVKGHGRGKQLSPALQGQQVSEFFQLCVWATDLKQCSQIQAHNQLAKKGTEDKRYMRAEADTSPNLSMSLKYVWEW